LQVVTTSHTFNAALVHAIGGAISTEARVFNNHGNHAGELFSFFCVGPMSGLV
jgi:hypothetical protein